MRNNERAKRDPFLREQYSVFEFTKLGMIATISIILIGCFMRLVFG